MSKAFKCEACKQYKDGKPHIVKIWNPAGNYDIDVRYELCPTCIAKIVDILTGRK